LFFSAATSQMSKSWAPSGVIVVEEAYERTGGPETFIRLFFHVLFVSRKENLCVYFSSALKTRAVSVNALIYAINLAALTH